MASFNVTASKQNQNNPQSHTKPNNQIPVKPELETSIFQGL